MKTKMALLGCLLATLTLVSGIALLSLSGWFISAAAFAGLTLNTSLAFNYFLPSAGVRLFSMLRILSRYAERIVTHEVTFKTLSTLRVTLYSALEPLAPAHLLRYRSGELLNRMVSDVDTLDQLYLRLITPLFAALSIIALLIFYLHYFSWTLAFLISGALLISLILAPLILSILGKKSGEKQGLLTAQLRSQSVEGVQGLADLILLGQWQTHLHRIETSSRALIKTQFKMACIQGFANALLLTLSGFTLVLVIVIATPLVQTHQLNGANLALLALTALAAFEAIAPISLGAPYWSKIKLASQRLHALKTTPPSLLFPDQSPAYPIYYDIEFDQISFAYQPDQPIWKDYSLTIATGEHFILRGPSGMGKSTLMHLLSRCFDPQKGEIRIGGIPIKSLSEPDLRRLMSVITQRSHLFSATLKDNLLLAKPDAQDSELLDALQQVQLQEWFNTLNEGLNTWLGEGGTLLSGGQLRRLAVARALLHNAPIWLLDEPTEGLDQTTEAAFWAALAPAMNNKTILMIKHF
ncbi:MAG: thiol reductant ABC exporter subunit CydC [Gammaproteobacteria bacterium]|nr:thiol reductant ABC exporter subunit CydC [Gammaproteobacteria bacterium]